MWSNITGVVGNAIQKVQKLQNEIESQLDAAVGVDEKDQPRTSETNTLINENNTKKSLPDDDKNKRALKQHEEISEDNSLVMHEVSLLSTIEAVVPPSDGMLPNQSTEITSTPEKPKKVIRKKNPNSIKPSVVEKLSSNQNDFHDEHIITPPKPIESDKEKENYQKIITKLKADYKILEESIPHLINEETNRNKILLQQTIEKIQNEKDHEHQQILLKEKENFKNKIKNLKDKHFEEIINLKAQFKLSTVETNNDIPVNHMSSTNNLDEELLLKKQEILNLNELNHQSENLIKDYELQINELQNELQQKDIHFNEKIKEFIIEKSDLQNDLIKLKEIVLDRERALETSTKNLSEMIKQYQDAMIKIDDLNAEISEKDARNRQFQTNSLDEAELRKALQKFQEMCKERDERLVAFEQEGQALSRKQGEMEKSVRKSKAEVKERDMEIAKLKESKEQLVKAIEEMQDLLRKHEADTSNASKSLSAMQAVSQASAEKLSRLEAELSGKNEELGSQRRALENAWNECNELKRSVAELRADRDDLKRQIGDGASKVMETESSRREIEQREAVLRATSKQLQDSLQRQMQESNIREERLRDEILEMRKRWQEAIASRESMTSELGQATAPLLRQISSLQDSLRIKSEQWQAIEGSLSERALRAENAAEISEHKRLILEEQLNTFKQQHTQLTSRIHELQTNLQSCEESLEKLKKSESKWMEEKLDLESKLALEIGQRQTLQSTLRELEMRHKIDMQDAHDLANLSKTQRDIEISKLKREMEQMKEELETISNKNGKVSNAKKTKNWKSTAVSEAHDELKLLGGDQEEFVLNGGDKQSLYSPSNDRKGYDMMPGTLLNGDASYAAVEKMQLRNLQRDDELRGLNIQIQQLQASRNALLEEVSYLSNRNAQLEEQTSELPGVLEELTKSNKRIELLLVLLGEKDEELEGALSDMKEVKYMYQSHLEDLLNKIAPNELSGEFSKHDM